MSEMAPIGVFAEVTLGKMLQPSKKRADDIKQPYLRAANIHSSGTLNEGIKLKEMWFSEYERSIYDLRADDVLVVEGGAVGSSAYLSKDMPSVGFQNALNRLRPYENSDGRYLHYCLQSAVESGEIDAFCSTVSIPHFTAEKVGRFRIPFHSFETQRRITDYLDRETGELDAMIEKLEGLAERLNRRKSLFLDNTFNEFYEGETTPLWSVLKPVKNQGYPNEEVLSVYRDYGVILKSSRDDNLNRTPDNLNPYQLVLPGDLVVNKMKAWQGSLGVSEHQGIVSPDYQVARPIRDIFPRYLHFVLRTPRMISQYRNRSTGVRPAQWRLYWDEMSTLHIPCPPLEEQRRIADHLDDVTSKIDAMLAKVAELKDLLTERRAALITAVVTGRKDVA